MNQLRNSRREHYLETHLLPDGMWQWALDHHPILTDLSSGELKKLRELTTLFLHEKVFEAAEGQVLSENIRTSIAVQACLPILNLGIDWYDNWTTVVVVPEDFVQERQTRDKAGVVHEWKETDAGESWSNGPVVLAWQEVEASGWADGFNVVIHEAAHRLDMTDGSVNGRPALHEGMSARGWLEICSKAFDDLTRRVKRKGRSRIDPYATASDAEFFAVFTEYFFERGGIVLNEYPEVYRLLAAFYRQDPVARQNRRPPRGRLSLPAENF